VNEGFFLVLFPAERFHHSNPREGFLHRHNHLAEIFQFVLHRLARPAPIDANRHEASGEQHERHHRELPIH